MHFCGSRDALFGTQQKTPCVCMKAHEQRSEKDQSGGWPGSVQRDLRAVMTQGPPVFAAAIIELARSFSLSPMAAALAPNLGAGSMFQEFIPSVACQLATSTCALASAAKPIVINAKLLILMRFKLVVRKKQAYYLFEG